MSVAETTSPDEAVESAAAATHRWWSLSWLRSRPVLVESAATAALGTIVFVLGFGRGLRRLAGPLGAGDVIPGYVIAKLWGDGSPFGNSSIGYPFGIDLHYFPTTDHIQNAVAGVVSAVFHNPYVGLNFVFALSFPVTALAALWVFRLVGVRGPIAVVASLAYTAIPFHWLRLEHIYLATMYSAVLGVGLAILTGTGGLERRLAGRRRRSTVALLVTIAVLIAASGIYYACFTILLCSVAWVYRLAHRPSWRGALVSAIPITSTVFFTGVALAPAFVFLRAHPALHSVAQRLVIESVMYSGNLAFALTPAPMTQLPILKDLNPRIENAYAVASGSGTSGVVWYADFGSWFTVLAVAFACVGLFWSVRRGTRVTADVVLAAEDAEVEPHVSFGLVGFLLATTVLFYVPWGLNVVFAALVTPQIRAWDRLVPVLMLLFVTAAMVAWRTMRLPQKGPRAAVIAVCCFALLLFDSVIPYQATFAAGASFGGQMQQAGNEYAAAVNASIPGKCAMLQIPYQGYPEEAPLLAMGSGFWPALTNPGKQWTFGAMKGTVAAEWQEALGSAIDESAVSNLVAGGFCGIHVDRQGFTPTEYGQVSARLVVLLGPPVATGHSGDWTAYALPAAGSGKALDLLDVASLPAGVANFYYPADIAPRAGDATIGAEKDAFGPWWRATADRTDLAVSSIEPSVKFQEVRGSVQAGECLPRDVKVELSAAGETVTTSFHLAAGEQQDFILKLGHEVTQADLVVSAPGVGCVNADKNVVTVAIHQAKAR